MNEASASAPTLLLDLVSRRLSGRTVVHGLSLELDRGKVLGLLGVNGAGKTTTLKMIAGVLRPSAGHVRIEGEDLAEHPGIARAKIGYLPEVPPLHDELDTGEYLRFCARLRGLDRAGARRAVENAIERCELGDVRRRLLGALSKGLRQRVGLAQAILHDPALVVLDEPASGLDPVQSLRLRAIVRELGADHAVVLSTHRLPDVVASCDEVAILHEGELRYRAAVESGADGTLRVGFDREIEAKDWSDMPVASVMPLDGSERARRWRVRMAEGVTRAALAAAIVAHGFGLDEFRDEGGSLEETFMRIAAGEAKAA